MSKNKSDSKNSSKSKSNSKSSSKSKSNGKNKKKKNGNGEGSVYKIENGYRGQIVVGIDDEGKPIRRSVTGKSKKEVTEKLTKIKYSMITGTYVSQEQITLPELARQMLKDDLNMNFIRVSTYSRHIETLKRIEANHYMKTTPMQQLSYTGVKEYLLTETRAAQSVIDKIFLMIQRTMREGVKRTILTKNQLEGLRKPRSEKRTEKVRALTKEEQIKLYEVLTTEDVTYSHQMLLSMLTGMRMGEINALKIDDINLNMKTISISRTISRDIKGRAYVSQTAKTENGNRVIGISETVMPLVKEILQCAEDSEYLFIYKGKHITTSQVNMEFKRTLEKYGIVDSKVQGKVSLHSLRHTYATRCIEAGMQAKVLQHLLGHSDISITLNTYCDAFESFQRENIAMADEYLAGMGIGSGNLRLLKTAG